ncbi:hypothetical protein Bhyg_01342 [Pseudolycoriella hygida]|uniref:Uncharacterized protein n=1 Tax=Pseudolycoriella hygida TaxID=35572 RepID=A0A9Q0S5G1_9DIPT|nr:hypothetical protein Bhyg_01342 [Pseudolycoriella hygida]
MENNPVLWNTYGNELGDSRIERM